MNIDVEIDLSQIIGYNNKNQQKMKKQNSQNSDKQKTFSKNEIKSVLLQILEQYQVQKQNKMRAILQKQTKLLKQQIIKELKVSKEIKPNHNHSFQRLLKFQSNKKQKISKEWLTQLKKQQQTRNQNDFTNCKSKQILKKLDYVPLQERVKDIVNQKQYNIQKIKDKYKEKEQDEVQNQFKQYLFGNLNRCDDLRRDEILNKYDNFMKKIPNINQKSQKIAQGYHQKLEIQNLNVFQRLGEYSKDKKIYNPNTSQVYQINRQDQHKQHLLSSQKNISQQKSKESKFFTPIRKKQTNEKNSPSPFKKIYKTLNKLTPSKSSKFIEGRQKRQKTVQNLMRNNREKIYKYFENINGRSYLYHGY